MAADVIAIVGAPRTGKSALASHLATRIADETGLACICVDGAAPTGAHLPDAWDPIDRAAASHDIVIADGTPLLAAVEAVARMGDGPPAAGRSGSDRLADAVTAHRQCRLTLLTAFEGTNAAAGAIDDRLRQVMRDHGLAWSVVGGPPASQVERALDAVTAVLAGRAAPKAGLFTRLRQRQADDDARSGAWVCARCDDPACEHASRRAPRG